CNPLSFASPRGGEPFAQHERRHACNTWRAGLAVSCGRCGTRCRGEHFLRRSDLFAAVPANCGKRPVLQSHLPSLEIREGDAAKAGACGRQYPAYALTLILTSCTAVTSHDKASRFSGPPGSHLRCRQEGPCGFCEPA